MSNKLKPCPFCGANVRKVKGMMNVTMFACDNCGADVCFYGKEKEDKAIEAWNRRVKDVD